MFSFEKVLDIIFEKKFYDGEKFGLHVKCAMKIGNNVPLHFFYKNARLISAQNLGTS